MPYKSQAQRRLFHHLAKQGKLSPEVVEEYDRESKGKKMPEYVKRKAFGGEVEAKAGVHCPACDLPLDSAPVALDAGEGCPRCGYGDAKDVPHKSKGGEVMEPTTYRARGGEVYVPLKALGGMVGNMKEMYPHEKSKGSHLDDGRGGFAKALRRRR